MSQEGIKQAIMYLLTKERNREVNEATGPATVGCVVEKFMNMAQLVEKEDTPAPPAKSMKIRVKTFTVDRCGNECQIDDFICDVPATTRVRASDNSFCVKMRIEEVGPC